jgi:hypothetical protein
VDLFHPSVHHSLTSQACNLDLGVQAAKMSNQRTTVEVTRFFSGNQEDALAL